MKTARIRTSQAILHNAWQVVRPRRSQRWLTSTRLVSRIHPRRLVLRTGRIFSRRLVQNQFLTQSGRTESAGGQSQSLTTESSRTEYTSGPSNLCTAYVSVQKSAGLLLNLVTASSRWCSRSLVQPSAEFVVATNCRYPHPSYQKRSISSRTFPHELYKPAPDTRSDIRTNDTQVSSQFLDALFGEDNAVQAAGGNAEEEQVGKQLDEQVEKQTVPLPDGHMYVRLFNSELSHVAIPIEDFTPDHGEDVPYYQFTEATFNRLTHPDGKVVDWDWQNKMLEITRTMRNPQARPESKDIPQYAGLAIPVVSDRRPPWKVSREDQRSLTAVQILSLEMETFMRRSSLQPEERRSRKVLGKALVSAVHSIVNTPHGEDRFFVELFGSVVTGLDLPFSDVDIKISPKNARKAGWINSAELREMKEDMLVIYKQLAQIPQFSGVTLENATIPLVEGRHSTTGVAFQIVPGKPSYTEDRYTRQLIRASAHFKVLHALLRTALHARRLTETYDGGINSYVLSVMIGTWQTRGHLPDTAGEQLLSFLTFWSSFNTSRFGMSSRGLFCKHFLPSGLLQRHEKAARRRNDRIRAGQWSICRQDPPMSWLLCLQSPTVKHIDLGKRIYAIKHILKTFEYLLIKLKKGMAVIDTVGSIDASLLDPLVGDSQVVLNHERKNVFDFVTALQAAKEASSN